MQPFAHTTVGYFVDYEARVKGDVPHGARVVEQIQRQHASTPVGSLLEIPIIE
jgi:hypothetical protein